MPTWQDWKQFLFGTPKRVVVFSTILAVVFVPLLFPGFVTHLVERIFDEVIAPVLKLVIMILVLVFLFNRFIGGGGKKKH